MREKRRNDFVEKVINLKNYFMNKAKGSDSTRYLQEYFQIAADPEEENNKKDLFSLNIFWRDRVFNIDKDGLSHTEYGAKLSLRCSYNGYVTITLFPCYTDKLRCREDSLVLFKKLVPKNLDKPLFLLYLWKTFVSYSLVTALDGNPSRTSRGYVRVLRYFCSKNVNGTVEGTRFWHDLKSLVGILFAVLSSSLFVYFLPVRCGVKEMQELKERLIHQERIIDSLTIVVNQRKDGVADCKNDSLLYYIKSIERNITSK